MSATIKPPIEHNVSGIDYAERAHLRYAGPPIIDIHAHVTLTHPSDPAQGSHVPAAPESSIAAAEMMLEAAREFGIERTLTMCNADHIPRLRDRFGSALAFNGSITKKAADSPDDDAYRLLDQFLAEGVQAIKFWAAPRGRDRGLFVDAPWRIEAARRAIAAGVKTIMVHVADPDAWFRTVYTDAAKYGTKPEQYTRFARMLEMFPEATWIGAHMGGDVEHPDHLEALLERYPHLCFDTSATKWQVREASARRDDVRALICRHPRRFLFGVDLVTRHGLPREHYISRYWCQRSLWESAWEGPSPIADPDFVPGPGGATTPLLSGMDLPADVLEQVYRRNALSVLGTSPTT